MSTYEKDAYATDRNAALKELLNKKIKVSIAATGAGAGFQNLLWQMPGCSSFLAGCAFPYDSGQTDEFLGFKQESYCTADSVLEMAMAAYMKAYDAVLASGNRETAIGLAMSGSVSSNRDHKGEHRVFISAVTDLGATMWHVALEKTNIKDDEPVEAFRKRVRARDGDLCDLLLFNALCEATGIEQVGIVAPENYLSSGTVKYSEVYGTHKLRSTETAPDQLRALFFKHPVFFPSGRRVSTGELDIGDAVLIPGSFNPIHAGHRNLAATVERLSNKRAVYVMTADSVHKKPLTVPEMLKRAAGIKREKWEGNGHSRAFMFTEKDPLFLDKARRFPNTPFAVGADAIVTMLDPKWGIDPSYLLEALRGLGTTFYIRGRDIPERGFVTINDIPIPEEYRFMFHHVEGRHDLSSTAIRETLA